MRILCPIEYEIHGRTKTNKRLSRHFYREFVAVDIAEIDGDDAPVAVSWTPKADPALYSSLPADRAISGPDGKQLTRWHDNAHWQRMCDGHFYGRKERGPLTTPQHLEKMLHNPNQASAARAAIGMLPPIDVILRTKIVNVDSDPRGKFDTIRSDGREHQLMHLNRVLAGLISVDGKLHRRCIEPFLSISLCFENEELRVRDLGIEATHQALWGPTTTAHAFFGLSQWHKALKLLSDNLSAGPTEIPEEPEVLLEESLTYDWDVTFKAAFEARELQRSLATFSRLSEPRLEKVIASLDADEQYEIMSSLDPDSWTGNAAARRSYEKTMQILEDREVRLTLSASSIPKL